MAVRTTTYNKKGQLETSSTAPSIKPSHKGRLHKALGVKKGAKIPLAKLQAAKRSKNPARRRQATFALNARKWKH